MNKTICNPLDLPYRYQHMNENGRRYAYREGADPTLVYYMGQYLLFASMSAGFFYSKDMTNWQFHPNPDLLIYDYAPDVRQIGDYLYFCASRRGRNCPILRSADPFGDDFIEVSTPFDFWDPNIFCDDDGRVYFYWGCTNTDPIYGVELDPATMQPIGEKRELIFGREAELGYERPGDNGVVDVEHSVVYQQLKNQFDPVTQKIVMPAGMPVVPGYDSEALTRIFLSVGKPYIEGAFMTKHQGRYYLQYACPGTQYNTYADGVYVGDAPLGPFTLQASNPFSAKPGGFATGAGHGSTIADAFGNYWHASTMRISVNHDFERRVGLFPAGFDGDGMLYCNQNFADYPLEIPQCKFDAREIKPKWMLLSYRKPTTASSTAPGSDTALAVDENIRTWWSAATSEPGQWFMVDLEKRCDIRAIQVNFADEGLVVDLPQARYGDDRKTRSIELEPQVSHFVLQISSDGETWQTVNTVDQECVNAYLEHPEGLTAQYVRVVGGSLPYGQAMRISGLRVFGNGAGSKPAQAAATATRLGALDAKVTWQPIPGAQGCNVRYGIAPDKLYQSWLVYGTNEVTLTTLMAGQNYYICVDSFNENGITQGKPFALQ